ncbi:MAG: N-acetylneuraminate synthase [Alphaproteobacteria bacterium]
MTRKTLIIAEAGVNHNGSLDMAVDLVDAAASCGADMVKFQTFSAKALVTASAPRAPYQETNTGDAGSQLEMLERLELDHAAHQALLRRCAEKGIRFLSTPFDPGSLSFLAHDLDLPVIKLGSSELTNGPLLVDAGRTGKSVILSTGMGTLAEVERALGALAFGYSTDAGAAPEGAAFDDAWADAKRNGSLKGKVTVLHCTTAYPTPPDGVNLSAIATMRDAFDLPIGFSDHTPGIAAATAAVALGASAIEKHITLDRTLPGPDHKASLEPDGFAAMVDAIREVEQVMGTGTKQPHACEEPNIPIARKSVVAAADIPEGAKFTPENLVIMRPGTGRDPFDYWPLIGRRAKRDYIAGDLIGETE